MQSTLQDLSGPFVLHALLAGGLDLGLRAELAMDLGATPIPLHARLWLATANLDVDPPLIETDSVVAADGTFDLHAEPLVLAAGATPGLNTAVSANVVLHAATQSPTAWCGTATGDVTQPLALDLSGSTFAARRDDAGTLALTDVPQSCFPRTAPAATAASSSRRADGARSVVGAEHARRHQRQLDPRRQPRAGAAHALVGRARLHARRPGGAGGSLDGALRRATDPPGSVALTTSRRWSSPTAASSCGFPRSSSAARKRACCSSAPRAAPTSSAAPAPAACISRSTSISPARPSARTVDAGHPATDRHSRPLPVGSPSCTIESDAPIRSLVRHRLADARHTARRRAGADGAAHGRHRARGNLVGARAQGLRARRRGATEGAVRIKWYLGGVAGDEREEVERIRATSSTAAPAR